MSIKTSYNVKIIPCANMCLTCVRCGDPTCRSSPLCLSGNTFYIVALMPANYRKRKRGRNTVEVDLESVEDLTTVTYEHVEYDTPAGRFTKRIEVPYTYTPSASTAPNPSQNNVSMGDECPSTFDAAMEAETEPTPAKKRNKVFPSAACTIAVQSNV